MRMQSDKEVLENREIELTETVNRKVEEAYTIIRMKAAQGRRQERLSSEDDTPSLMGQEDGMDRAVRRDERKQGKADKTMTSGKRKAGRRRPRRIWAAAAVLAATLGLGAVVLAAAGFFTKEEKLTEDGVLTYEFALNYDLKPGRFQVEASYIPEGYQNYPNLKPESYAKDADFYDGYTICGAIPVDALDEQESRIERWNVTDVEHRVLSGLEADVVTHKENPESGTGMTDIYLFNPEEGYVVWLWGDYKFPREELVKVADSLTITRTGDAEYLSEEEKEARQSEEESEQAWMDQWTLLDRQGIDADRIVPLGEEAAFPDEHRYDWVLQKLDDIDGLWEKTKEQLRREAEAYKECLREDHETMTVTVTNIQFTDSLPAEFADENVYDREALDIWLEDDGTLKPYIRKTVAYDKTTGLEQLLQTEQMEQMFLTAEVEITVDRPEGLQAGRTPLYASLVPMEREGDHFVYARTVHLREDGRPMRYHSEPAGVTNDEVFSSESDRLHQFFYRTFADGETYRYKLLFVVDKDLDPETTFLQFADGGQLFTTRMFAMVS